MARTVPRSAVPGSTLGAWGAVFSAICVKKKGQRREKNVRLLVHLQKIPGLDDDSFQTASKLDVLCPLRHVMFVSPQKHTVTREGHEVRDSVSENICKEEGRRQERLRHAHILSVCGSLATIVSLGDSYRIHECLPPLEAPVLQLLSS